MNRRNGILAYPHNTVAALCRFASAVYANFVLGVKPRLFTYSPEFVAKLKGIVKASPVALQSQSYIRVDYSDLPKSYPKEQLAKEYPFLPLRIEKTGPPGVLGSFYAHPSDYRIEVYLSYRVPESEQDYEVQRAQLCNTMRHETQHFVQMALSDIVHRRVQEKNKRALPVSLGVPGEYLNDPKIRAEVEAARVKTKLAIRGLSPFAKPEERSKLQYDLYVLEPREFFPWIADYRATLYRSADKSGRIDLAELDRRISSGTDPKDHFIQRLKVLAPSLFRRAYIELRAFIENHNAKAVEAKRKKSRPKTATSVVSTVIESLDSTDPLIAGYARQHRAKYVAYAQSKMNP